MCVNLICSALCCNVIELTGHWCSRIEVTVLENKGGISEYEIDDVVNVAFSIKLAASLVSSSFGKITNAKPSPIEPGFKLVIEYEKKVVIVGYVIVGGVWFLATIRLQVTVKQATIRLRV
ncbi:hypothetical protein L1887_09036 [Cichorium endivia]|nr:hypothetical protein L1887_09036 [Cichorium endivia]